MTTLLRERRISFEGLSFVLLKSAYAEALAVNAAPSIKAATSATRLIHIGRSDGTLKPFGTLAVAFSGRVRPERDVIYELREACVYLAGDDLRESAVENALTFLADVESRMPKILEIVGRRPHA